MKNLVFILTLTCSLYACQPDVIQGSLEITNLGQLEAIPKGSFGFSITQGNVNGSTLTLNIAHSGCDPKQHFKLFHRQVGHKVCVADTLHLVFFTAPEMCERLNQFETTVDISTLSNCTKTLIIKGGDKDEFIINR